MKSNGEHTIESGLQALQEKADFHVGEAKRFQRLVEALKEAGGILKKASAPPTKPVGRPKSDDINSLLNVIKTMPDEFKLTELKDAAKINPENFRRIFREIKREGQVITVVEATGRRDGIYKKKAT